MSNNETQGNIDHAGDAVETVAPIDTAVENLPDPSIGQDRTHEPAETYVPRTETPAEAMPPPVNEELGATSGTGVMIGRIAVAEQFVPTSHLRIARHSGKFAEGSEGSPIVDRLQQAWIDQNSFGQKVEWRDVQVVIFDEMPPAVSPYKAE